jgi:hypothetical protein
MPLPIYAPFFQEHDYGVTHKLAVLHYAVQYVSQEFHCYYFSGPQNRNS